MTPEQLNEARKIAAISAPGSGIALLVEHIDVQAAEIEWLKDVMDQLLYWDNGKYEFNMARSLLQGWESKE